MKIKLRRGGSLISLKIRDASYHNVVNLKSVAFIHGQIIHFPELFVVLQEASIILRVKFVTVN